MSRSTEIYNDLTNQIIKLMEQGVPPWQHPVVAQSGGLPLRANGEPYQGLNILACWASSIKHGWTGQQWFTFKQMDKLGGRLVEGSKGKGTYVFFYGSAPVDQADPDAGWYKFSKPYTVWNSDQIEGLPKRFELTNELLDNPPVQPLEDFFAATGSDVSTQDQGQCFYIPSRDQIVMPPIERFRSVASYYATLAHEHVHWTGATHRLDRVLNTNPRRSEYAYEELIAELGSAFLMQELGAVPVQTESHAAYLEHWLRGLKNDRRMLQQAATKASEAVAFLKTEAAASEQRLAA